MSIQNQQKKLVIGLFGFGVVGEGLYKVLKQTPGLNAEIRKCCILHPEKKRNAPAELFTTDPELLLRDPAINVIVELINDAEAAYYVVSTALKGRKAVVSANKKLIAEHLEELISLQQQAQTPFLYEAACCASIPVIRNLEEYYDNDLLHSISGIVNGSTNYILTRVSEDGGSYRKALQQAQEEGFAETDPRLDVEGVDALNKLTLLLAHGYGIISEPGGLLYYGIQNIHENDIVYAREKGYRIKLVAQARKLENGEIAAFVLPQFIEKDSQLYNVSNEYNGVLIESSLADEQFFYGKGAGSLPTASAVLSDLSALRYNYSYEYKKLLYQSPSRLATDFFLKVYMSFDALFQVPQELFENIESWSSSDKRCHVIGVIHYARLLQNGWWKKPGTSLVLLPAPLAENTGVPVKADEALFVGVN